MNGAASAKCGFRTELPDEATSSEAMAFWSCSRVYPAYQIQPVPFMAGASVIHNYRCVHPACLLKYIRFIDLQEVQ
jgi:hypothetical protein